MRDPELWWAAGLFDGEGSTYFQIYRRHKGREYGRVVLQISQYKTPEVLHRFHAAVGVGAVRGPYINGYTSKNERWHWAAVGRSDARAALALLLPLVSTPKREQARLALARERQWRKEFNAASAERAAH